MSVGSAQNRKEVGRSAELGLKRLQQPEAVGCNLQFLEW